MKKLLIAAVCLVVLIAGAGVWRSLHSVDALITPAPTNSAPKNVTLGSAPALPVQGNAQPDRQVKERNQQPEPIVPPGYTYIKSPLPGHSHYQSDPEPTVEEVLSSMPMENREAYLRLREHSRQLQALQKELREKAKGGGFNPESNPEAAAINRKLQAMSIQIAEERRIVTSYPTQLPDAFWSMP